MGSSSASPIVIVGGVVPLTSLDDAGAYLGKAATRAGFALAAYLASRHDDVGGAAAATPNAGAFGRSLVGGVVAVPNRRAMEVVARWSCANRRAGHGTWPHRSCVSS